MSHESRTGHTPAGPDSDHAGPSFADDEGFTGPATVHFDGESYPAQVQLRGHFQPLDGKFHWFGRVRLDPGGLQALRGKKRTVSLETEQGSAEASLSDEDPWGRLRANGTGRPPFEIGVQFDAAELR